MDGLKYVLNNLKFLYYYKNYVPNIHKYLNYVLYF